MTNKATFKQPNTPEEYVNTVQQLIDQAKEADTSGQASFAFEHAITMFANGMERFPESALLYFECGRACRQGKDIAGMDLDDDAYTAFRVGLKFAEDPRDLLHELATLCIGNEKYSEAEEYYFEMLLLDLANKSGLKDVRALSGLAALYEEWGYPQLQAGCVWKVRRENLNDTDFPVRRSGLSGKVISSENWYTVFARLDNYNQDQQAKQGTPAPLPK